MSWLFSRGLVEEYSRRGANEHEQVPAVAALAWEVLSGA